MLPNNRLEVHCLNVDHGDCTIIRHPGDQHKSKGRISFVDINDWKDRQAEDEQEGLIAGLSGQMGDLSVNASQSKRVVFKQQISEDEYAEKYLDDPLEYFRSEVAKSDQDIWRFVCTHPDMDHLSGLDRLWDEESISVFWDTAHNKDLSDAEYWPPEYDEADWDQYAKIRDGETDCQYLQPTRGSQEQYWEDDNIEILHPSPDFVEEMNEENEDEDQPEYNDISYVLKLNTRAGAILLPGDAEQDAWDTILDYRGEDVLEDVRVLKASHHGRDDGFHKEAVEAMDPEYVVLSVGAKPNTDAHQKYRRTCSDDTEIWSTRQYGTVSFTITNRGAFAASCAVPDGIFDLPEE
ncbi:ComEC/Rec2 family competence protein [Halobacterium salinarum]|uniref:ComEC/Rec2 family competence protein n=2 Tax=Halobacterium salinarum TaxID=2242 RepID=UPI0025527A93|nr:hydrolase [Halobacterium salinarum]MDL0122727.1 hydrolase [Halobacterium salinarum]